MKRRKVRVLKEMPFAKVGKELEVICGFGVDVVFINDTAHKVDPLIGEWLEWVEGEKSFEEKLRKEGYFRPEEIAQIAKEHYLGVFDKVDAKYNVFRSDMVPMEQVVECYRKALEDA